MSDRETRLREIRERVEKATPGPWKMLHCGHRDCRVVGSVDWQWDLPVRGHQENADFIAHAREDVPWMLAEVERLREELDGVNCELELRKTLHVQPEESEHIARTSDLLIRTLQENRDLRERLEILECYEEDTRGRLNPDARDIQRMAAFEYPGSAVDG